MKMKTDTQLQQDVLDELHWEPSVRAAGIGVEVRDGVVTLAGHVSSYGEKWSAERAALRVAGVRALAVEMDVALPAQGRRSDADIAHAAQRLVACAVLVPSDALKIMVEGGWVTLTGTVQWRYQQQAALEVVRALPGIKGLSDRIAIEPLSDLGAVKSDIEAALRRRSATEDHCIAVHVDGGDVTLRGIVNSEAERELAHHSAWGTPGVRRVVDDMTLVY
jgi:osmotically-inducible protein OsmY